MASHQAEGYGGEGGLGVRVRPLSFARTSRRVGGYCLGSLGGRAEAREEVWLVRRGVVSCVRRLGYGGLVGALGRRHEARGGVQLVVGRQVGSVWCAVCGIPLGPLGGGVKASEEV